MRSTTQSAVSHPPAAEKSGYASALRNPQVWRRTLFLGLPVGLMQATLNQGDHWLHHHVDAAVMTKTVLSPLLACLIAFVSAATSSAPLKTQITSR